MKRNRFLTLLIISIICFRNDAQSQCTDVEELYRKRLKDAIAGCNYGNPYTLFDKTQPNFNVTTAVLQIRDRIIKEKNDSISPIYDAYNALYTNAVSTLTGSDNGLQRGEGPSRLASWAKNNAFVFLIGLDGTGLKLDSIDPTEATRNVFRDRAL